MTVEQQILDIRVREPGLARLREGVMGPAKGTRVRRHARGAGDGPRRRRSPIWPPTPRWCVPPERRVATLGSVRSFPCVPRRSSNVSYASEMGRSGRRRTHLHSLRERERCSLTTVETASAAGTKPGRRLSGSSRAQSPPPSHTLAEAGDVFGVAPNRSLVSSDLRGVEVIGDRGEEQCKRGVGASRRVKRQSLEDLQRRRVGILG